MGILGHVQEGKGEDKKKKWTPKEKEKKHQDLLEWHLVKRTKNVPFAWRMKVEKVEGEGRRGRGVKSGERLGRGRKIGGAFFFTMAQSTLLFSFFFFLTNQLKKV